MTTPKEFFERGGLNPEMGVAVHDWYAVGSAFLPPVQDKGNLILAARNLICTDMASFFTMDFEVLPRHGASTTAADLVPLLTRVFKQFGRPHVGVVLSHSVWVSSAVMATDPDLKDRGEVLAHCGVSFPEMSLAEKDRIFKWIVAQGLKCEFDADNIGSSRPPMIQVAPASHQEHASSRRALQTTEWADPAVEEATNLLLGKWGSKTLAMLRAEAMREANGTAFDSVRVKDGQRLFLVLCATESKDISTLEQLFDFIGEDTGQNWETFTLADMVVKTGFGTGLSYESMSVTKGRREAIVLCAANSEAVRLMERVFGFPRLAQ